MAIVNVVDSMEQCITLSFLVEKKEVWFSFIYAVNESIGRRNLWNHLEDLRIKVGQKPWIVAEDFNVLLRPEECSKFDQFQGLSADMKEFRECVEHTSLFDHPFSGFDFTWTNKQDNTFQARKLDRVMVTNDWYDLGLRLRVEFLNPGVSDHCAASIQLFTEGKSPSKPFKFFNFWVRHGEFMRVLEESWQEPIEGDPMLGLFNKLRRLKIVLRQFN